MSVVEKHSAAYWTAANPILGVEIYGAETDTFKTKYGDGVTAWNDLEYTGLLLVGRHIELDPELKNLTEEGIIAFAGGGQADATVLNAHYSFIDTVGTTGDSCKCPPAVKNSVKEMINAGANDANIYPAIGERFKNFNTLMAINDPIVLASGNGLKLVCYSPGIWRFI